MTPLPWESLSRSVKGRQDGKTVGADERWHLILRHVVFHQLIDGLIVVILLF